MTHPADFADAHERHWEDAELLFNRQRWANADHLYGLSAECGLKAVMKGLGMRVDAQGRPKKRQHIKHVDQLWRAYGNFVRRRGKRNYILASVPFKNWSINDRYANRRHFANQNVAPHRDATLRVRDLIQRAQQDGVL